MGLFKPWASLLGKLKAGDIPAHVRDAAIRKMVELYFPANTVMITGYGFDMLYAGPREAVLHAVFRQNMGTDYLIVGRDHAGKARADKAAQKARHESATAKAPTSKAPAKPGPRV